MHIVRLGDLPPQGVSHDPTIVKKVLIGEGKVPHLRNLSQARLTAGQAAHAHAHSGFYEIFLVESGEGLLLINGREYPLKPGTCVVAEPAESHEISNTGQADLVITYFGLNA